MSYYLLPKINNVIKPNNIRINFTNTNLNIYINKSLSIYLNFIKSQINNYLPEWDNIKKRTNTYEYIHTHIPWTKNSVNKLKPLSRSFFKMIEICKLFKLLENYEEKNINSFHLAEGPGGFIEALVHLRKNPQDKYYGMTLLDSDNINVPGWNKTKVFLKNNKNVIIENGKDNTGNLYSSENYKYCVKKYSHSIDIITGDGGFDFSINFEKQEFLALRLIFTQIAYAISMQKKGGHFILKVFDVFLQSTVELIFFLSSFYESVYIVKPHTSRYANSERYIVCKHFKYENIHELSNKLISVFIVLEKLDYTKYYIKSIINIPIPRLYLNQIIEINAILGQHQIENLINTMIIIEKGNQKMII